MHGPVSIANKSLSLMVFGKGTHGLAHGRKKMGYTHGQHVPYGKDVPIAKLFARMQKRMDVQSDSVAASTGERGSLTRVHWIV